MVGLLSLAHLMAFVDRFAMSAVAGQIKSAFRIGETGLGALQGLAIALPYAAAILPFGRLADRLPPRRMVLIGLAIWTVGGLACAFCTSTAQLWAARMTMGVGQAAFIPASLALFAGAFRGGSLAQALSVFTAGSTLGKSVALLAAGGILSLDLSMPGFHALFGAPWRAVFILTAIPNLLLLLALAAVRLPPMQTAPMNGSAGRGAPLASPRFLTFALFALAPIVLIQATAAWTPVFYVRYFHFTPAHSAALLGIAVLVAAPVGHLVGGQLAAAGYRRDMFPGRLVAVCLAAAAAFSLIFCFAPIAALSMAGYGLIVLILGMAAPATLAGVNLLAPPGRAGAANALYMGLATLIGVGLGPTVVGAMSDAWFGGAGGLRRSLAVLMLAVPTAALALASICGRLWRTHAAAALQPSVSETSA